MPFCSPHCEEWLLHPSCQLKLGLATAQPPLISLINKTFLPTDLLEVTVCFFYPLEIVLCENPGS